MFKALWSIALKEGVPYEDIKTLLHTITTLVVILLLLLAWTGLGGVLLILFIICLLAIRGLHRAAAQR